MADERSAGVIDRKLGDRVRARRLEIAMSQERLAERLGVTFQQVQKYEKGVNRIAVSRFMDIARALDISPAQFLDGLQPAAKSGRDESSVERALAQPGAAELVKLFATIRSDKIRRRVLELVRAMTVEA